ncbi:Mitochondrial uncoupling protein 4 [Nymphon striatum]|nr:Mitochondrial uncoupling protein 4 [Nymphon striatum]
MGSGKTQPEQVTGHADTVWFKYILSVFSASIAEAATYPLDITKTRLQIQGELEKNQNVKSPRRGMMKTAFGIVSEEGLRKLWKGLTPAIYRQVVYSGCRMVAYEQIRNNILKKNPDGSFPLWKAVVGGLCAGAFGQFLASPTDLVKVQLQTEGKRRLEGKPARVHGTAHAFRKILKKGGIRGLWKGWVPNVQRAALINMGGNVCSGLMASILGTPADVIKTRVMNQPTDANGRGLLYKSSSDCLMKSVKQEGFFALYKGFIPTWARLAPWYLIFWLSYEQVRKLTGASSF